MSRRARRWTDRERLQVVDTAVRLVILDGLPAEAATAVVAREHRVPVTAIRSWAVRFGRDLSDPPALRAAFRERLALRLAERAASAEEVEDADRLARSSRLLGGPIPTAKDKPSGPPPKSLAELRAEAWAIKADLDRRKAATQ